MTDKVKVEKKILIIRESTTESVIQDGVTLFMLLTVILISYLLNSQAVGWLGAFMLFLALFARWAHRMQTVFTIPEARKELDRLEAEIKGGK